MAVSEPIGNIIAGTPVHIQEQTTTVPGGSKVVFQTTVPNGKKYKLFQLFVACRIESSWELTSGSDVIASGRTGAAVPNSKFSWVPSIEVLQNSILTLTLSSRTNSPIVDCEAYLQASELNG